MAEPTALNYPEVILPRPLLRSLLRAVFLLAAALCAGICAAQDYPNKPIRIIDGFPPGGNTDFLARVVGQKLSENWGQPVVVENRPGAAGNIGADAVAKAAPDGYTLLIGTIGALAPSMALYPKLPYDLLRDFAPVGVVADSLLVLFVHPSLPVKSLKDLVTLAKARPGELNYASCGVGCVTHLATESFMLRTRVNMTHVAYKGGSPATAAVVSGESQVGFGTLATSLTLIKAGRIRPLAVSTPQRAKSLPAVPTIAESGYPGFDITMWYGLLAPAGTPPAIVSKLNLELARILKSPAVAQRLASVELEPRTGTPEQFGAILRSELTLYSDLVKAAGIKAE
jgi:tripartite-type tricarboxylate transporter receptor subunit TctC